MTKLWNSLRHHCWTQNNATEQLMTEKKRAGSQVIKSVIIFNSPTNLGTQIEFLNNWSKSYKMEIIVENMNIWKWKMITLQLLTRLTTVNVKLKTITCQEKTSFSRFCNFYNFSRPIFSLKILVLNLLIVYLGFFLKVEMAKFRSSL